MAKLQTTERGLQDWGRNAARELGCLWFKTVADGVRGFPDVTVIGPWGKVAFIELKSPRGTGRVSASQEYVIQSMRSNGANVYVCSTHDHIVEVLEFITSR